MKKYALLFIFILVFMVGCGKEEKEEKYYTGEFFDKTFVNNEDTDQRNIYFGTENHHFSYYYSSGDPVDDSDLCETFRYDEPSSKIILNCESGKEEIDLISYKDKELVLKIKGKEIKFSLLEMNDDDE